ncbi:MAG: hypothetical protein C4541_00865 [Candidatus Auribacter fodinae]|jgi:hypothetical protein|uniref:Aerotolerance regulator N-terminal domain-containing protein n=1 Tax=Candidatus Auribacter fodinae TaxID=2093366 RepID=A0A3A4RFX0_9BACT|nr:MAG: hypothetical protein C4541_00865 [Candidatus Auribacter fodinae]
MQFLNPWYFWFLPILAIPVILNIWKKLRIKDVEFPYFFLLAASTSKNVIHLKILNLLLLIVRILLIACILLALARPLFTASPSPSATDAAASARVYILDNSPSMEVMVKGKTLFDAARTAIENDIRTQNTSIPCALVTISQTGMLETIRCGTNADQIINELRRTAIQPVRFPAAEALSMADAFLGTTGRMDTTTLFFTDNQKSNWQDTPALSLPNTDEVYFIGTGDEIYTETGWTGYSGGSRLVVSGNNASLNSTVMNYRKTDLDNLIVQCLTYDNTVLAEKTVTVRAGETESVQFDFLAPADKRFMPFTLYIDHPDFVYDNRLPVSVPVYPSPAVYVPTEYTDSIYLYAALTLYSPATRIVPYSSIAELSAYTEPSETRILILSTPQQADQASLQQLSAQGYFSILFFAPGEQAQPARYAITSGDFSHFVLSPLRYSGVNSFDDLFISRSEPTPLYPQITRRKKILVLSDGTPFLEELTVGKKSVFICATDLNGTASNITRSASFLPLLHRITDYCVMQSSHHPDYYNRNTGTSLSLSEDAPFSATWIQPDNTRVPLTSRFAAGRYRIETPRAMKPGFYRLLHESGTEELFVFAPALQEGNMEPLDQTTIIEKMNDTPCQFINLHGDEDESYTTKKDISTQLILLACVLLALAELGLANISL